jgi:preprotein translocase subunit SecA
MMVRLGVPEDQPIENKMISNSIEKAQVKVEGNNFDIRKHLVEYDDVINKQREIIYQKRSELLQSVGEDPLYAKKQILEMVEQEIEQVVLFHTSQEDQSQWNMKEIAEVAKTIFPIDADAFAKLESLEKIAGDKADDAAARTTIVEYLTKVAYEKYEALEKTLADQSGDPDYVRMIEREIILRNIDNLWVDHLDAISALRTGIGLRGYGQRDPLLEYKKETYQMFMQLQNMIPQQIVYSIYKVGYTNKMAASVMDKGQEQDAAQNSQFKSDPYKQARKADNSGVIEKKQRTETGEKVGRNDPCPCGSGKKYKKCCG